MPWIDQISDEEADGPIAELFESARKRAGGVANIIRLMSLNAEIAAESIQFYMVLMHSPATLSRSRREMLATVVSHANDCYY